MKNAKNIEIQMTDETAQGQFCNLAIINHTDSEFTADFIYLQPNTPRGKVQSRIILTPQHLKRFMLAVQDNIKKFEEKYGEIALRGEFYNTDVSFKKYEE